MDIFLFAATAGVSLLRKRHEKTGWTVSSYDSAEEQKLWTALQNGTSRDAGERVCTVTPDNIRTPSGHLRSEMRLQNLWHRATYILVLVKEKGDNSKLKEQQNQQSVLVQRRSQQKDYCPGKLDPTPGGVVGFGESYQENAEREVFEEMGVDVTQGNVDGNSMERLFTFSYQDHKVRVWGDFYQVSYYGSVKILTIQEEEVDEVLVLSMEELKTRIEESPDDFMPDACHAMKLYFQRKEDMQVKRRLLKGYSSGDLDRYNLRPKPKVIFFDCDDCLYFDNWKTAEKLTAKIEQWCVEKLGLPKGKAYELYKEHGTALRGLLAEGHIDDSPESIDGFLRDVHDIPIHDLIKPDKKLRELLLRMNPTIPKFIFTASVSHHAIRCLKALGIEDLFEDTVIDVKECDLETKHSRHSFKVAMDIAQVDDPEACIFLDDSVTNIRAAREIGWRSVLVGKVGRDCGKPIFSENAELEVERIYDIVEALPELFVGNETC
ncbi:NUDIX family hydrolase [Nitzschia inconspicua]|uniref:NUDIX family hydrolase n=1 Tax=Nitzschia inconspicua TaxID=303405 RepID=A0A9K3LGG7_9STRA|nr:NUDIX family hydrolase [Nitzschia inconspicua]